MSFEPSFQFPLTGEMKDVSEEEEKTEPVIFHVCVNFHSVTRQHCQRGIVPTVKYQERDV